MSKTGPKRIKSRSIDPLGGPFWDEEEKFILRECLPEQSRHLDSDSVQRAIDEGLIIAFQKQSLDRGKKVRLISPPLKFNSVGSVITGSHKFGAGELPQYLRLQAAKNWLRINNILKKDGLCLIDSHTANFAIDGNSRLVWIDLGSIQPMKNGLEGIREYRSFYEFPLKIMAKYPELSDFIRAGLEKHHRIFRRGYSYFTKLPVVQYKNFGLFMGFLTLMYRNGYSVPVNLIRSVSLGFLSLRLPKRVRSRGYWANYTERDSYPNLPSDTREKAVVAAVKDLNVSSILDAAGSDGKFLWLVRKNDCTHLLTDTEDTGISKFTKFISEKTDSLPSNSVFTGLVRDFRSEEFKADIVLALAITHHLSLSQWWTFESIADHLYKLSNKYVVVEFMPNGVGKYQSQYFETPDWYSLDNFVEAFEARFSNVQIIEETRNSNRVLISCKK